MKLIPFSLLFLTCSAFSNSLMIHCKSIKIMSDEGAVANQCYNGKYTVYYQAVEMMESEKQPSYHASQSALGIECNALTLSSGQLHGTNCIAEDSTAKPVHYDSATLDGKG